ncbi:MAG: histidine phosphatase family protein [Faecalibacterium sp.]|nr:histidine phosphatase family protein [Faecalibacterium sp.]
MQLVLVRHGEPDYAKDSLTQAGFCEAALLAKRIETWPVTAFYCSPLGRAQATAQPTLAALHRTAQTLPWLREFSCGNYQTPDGSMELGRTKSVPWDFYPDYWTADPRFGEHDHWMEPPVMQAQPEGIEARFAEVTAGIDALLAQYGYLREKGYYRIAPGAKRDALIVCFCHLGLADTVSAHLLHIAPPLLWQSFFMPPCSITVLNTEERQGDIAAFRCQVMGDTSHLRAGGEPVSAMGAFGTVFQG